jgi:hypothetical protein
MTTKPRHRDKYLRKNELTEYEIARKKAGGQATKERGSYKPRSENGRNS